MQTPKTRISSSEAPRKVSPRIGSLEVPVKISPRAVSSQEPRKASPHVVRQLKTTAQESTSLSSRTHLVPKNNSPKVTQHKAPQSPLSKKKRPSRVAELESQISQLESDLEKVKDQLSSSETRRKLALEDAEELKKQLLTTSLDVEEAQKQLQKQSVLVETQTTEVQKVNEQQDKRHFSELESVQQQDSDASTALDSPVNEIKKLKIQLRKVAESQIYQTKHAELSQSELLSLGGKLEESLVLMEDVKDQLTDCKRSEAHTAALVAETLLQLEAAKRTVEMLRSGGAKSMQACDAIASELIESKMHVNLLEELVNQLKDVEGHTVSDDSDASAHRKLDLRKGENESSCDSTGRSATGIEEELHSVKLEVEQLKHALETAEIRYNEGQTRSAAELRTAHELVEHIKSTSSQRETELEKELKKSQIEIEELKANLMDKETELQGICEENEFLNIRLKNALSGQREYDLEIELQKLRAEIEKLKANLMDKETELQNISEENEMLKLESRKKQINSRKVSEDIDTEATAVRPPEREALLKVGYIANTADKNNREVTRILEQLEASQAMNSELVTDLRRLKVQADQWRKAAEAAANVLSSGNNGKHLERRGCMNNHYSPNVGKINVPYSEDMVDDLLKNKSTNVLQRIGILRKKQQK